MSKRRLIAMVALGLGLALSLTMFSSPVSPRMKASPQWRDGRFRNPQPIRNDNWKVFTGLFRANPFGKPTPGTIPVLKPAPSELLAAQPEELKVTWLGHTTTYLDFGGTRILTDPVWSQRPSPVAWLGSPRFYDPIIDLELLPRPHIVVISHDHYDHLDRRTILAMKHWGTRFVVPLGVGHRLLQWGIAPSSITELDWWEATRVGSVEITATPSRHASGRGLFDQDKSLWAGYAFRSPEHRVYFSGDTGLFPGLAEIGNRLGPFDLTMLEIGAYDTAWPDWHLGPEQAVLAHVMLRGNRLLPIHWGLFNLARHGWTEPMERLQVAARASQVTALAPRPGEAFNPARHAPQSPWWPTLPWATAREVAIRAGGMEPEPMRP